MLQVCEKNNKQGLSGKSVLFLQLGGKDASQWYYFLYIFISLK